MLLWCILNASAILTSSRWSSMHCVKTRKKRNLCWWSKPSMMRHYQWSTAWTNRYKENKNLNSDRAKPRQSTQCKKIWEPGLLATFKNGGPSSKDFNLEFQCISKNRLWGFTSLNWRLLLLLGKKEKNSLKLLTNKEPLCRWKKVDKNCKLRWTLLRKRFNHLNKILSDLAEAHWRGLLKYVLSAT